MNRTATMALLAAFFCVAPARAQLSGENLTGDMGVKSATQPEPGVYVSSIFYRYRTDTLKGPNGKSMDLDPTGDANQTHGKKEGEVHVGNVSIDNVKVGQLLTLEGGVGKSFLHGAASIGMAYYAQWKVTPDLFELSPGSLPLSGIPDKHRVFGIGPEVTIPIATKTKLLSLVNVRYLWENGAQFKTQGQTFIVTNTVPIGGIKIPAGN